MTDLNLSAIWQAASGLGRQDFLVLPNRRYNYTQLCETIREFCTFFDTHDLRPGDRIVICTSNEYCVAAGFLAAVLHGLVPTNLAPTTKARRGLSIIQETDARLLIADAEISVSWAADIAIAHVAQPRKRPRFGLSRANIWPLEQLSGAGRDPLCPEDKTALAYLLFTSGSTSDPSGVMLTLGNLLANLESVGRVTDLRSGDRMFNDCPMPHTDGLIHGPVLAFATGATVVRAGGFQLSGLENWLDTIGREGCTQIITTPFIWSSICRYAEHDDYFSAPDMRLLISSAARLDLSLWDMVEDRFGKPLANEYGMTETVMAAFHAGPLNGMGTKGTIGLPAHCEARLEQISPDVTDCGELLVRGAAISPGYWKNPERTAATRTEDGWFRTGDIARADPDGNYELVGRAKSIINSAGLRIHPNEIDEVIESHSAVQCSVTVALPHKEFGEIAVSAVEANSNITTADLIEHARQHLEPMKVPKEIFVVDAIPRTDSGKPKLTETAELLAQVRVVDAEVMQGNSVDTSVEETVLSVAAQVFSCDHRELTLNTTQDDMQGWDSFSQLRLFLELEKTLAIRLPTRKLAAMRSLGDLAAAARESL